MVAQHRVLIFCQLKSMLDIVEHDLLKPKMPTVTYLRLDGSVPAGLRHAIVSRCVGASCFTATWTGVFVWADARLSSLCSSGSTTTHPLMFCC